MSEGLNHLLPWSNGKHTKSLDSDFGFQNIFHSVWQNNKLTFSVESNNEEEQGLSPMGYNRYRKISFDECLLKNCG